MRILPALVACLFLVPVVNAEFGAEDAGYPVNVDGETVFPYIPQDLAERHPELVEEMLAEGDPLNKVNGYTIFPYYALLTAEVQRLASENPDKVRMFSAGKSHLGLDLWVLEIANFDAKDRIPLEDREVIYLDGGTHSNEYSGVYFVTEWLQFLLDEYDTNETAQWIVDNRRLFVLPMVNPDGSHLFGRLNAITVNINRNFPGTWGTVEADQWPLNWPGPYPASEPETQAVIDVIQMAKPDFVQSTHCCGNLWLHPYGAEHLGNAPDIDMFTNICENVFPDLTINVSRIRCGETWSTIYPAGGTTLDEGYAQVGAASWSYEMSGRGAIAPWGQPIVDTDVRVQEIESWRGVMHGMLHAEKYGALPTVTSIDVNGRTIDVTVQNQGWGNVTIGQIQVGETLLALPALEPGESTTWSLPGDYDAGDAIPVNVEWKKRIHADSNWGSVVFNVPVTDVAGDLLAEVPVRNEPPSMGELLPDVADFKPEAQPADSPASVANAADEGSKDTPLYLAPLLVVGLVVLALRRRS